MKKSILIILALIVSLSAPLAAGLPPEFLGDVELDNPFEDLLAEAPATPQARFDSWQKAIREFAREHLLILNESQMLSLLDALELVQIDAFEGKFVQDLEPLRTSLNAMEEALSTDAFISLLERFKGLQGWLYKNNLIKGLVVKSSGICNCKANNGCQNSTCQAVSCTSEEGSKNWGRCGAGAPE